MCHFKNIYCKTWHFLPVMLCKQWMQFELQETSLYFMSYTVGTFKSHEVGQFYYNLCKICFVNMTRIWPSAPRSMISVFSYGTWWIWKHVFFTQQEKEHFNGLKRKTCTLVHLKRCLRECVQVSLCNAIKFWQNTKTLDNRHNRHNKTHS